MPAWVWRDVRPVFSSSSSLVLYVGPHARPRQAQATAPLRRDPILG